MPYKKCDKKRRPTRGVSAEQKDRASPERYYLQIVLCFLTNKQMIAVAIKVKGGDFCGACDRISIIINAMLCKKYCN